jgi:hypothetical protein
MEWRKGRNKRMKRQSRINLDLHQSAVGATPTTTLAPRSSVSSRPMRRPLEAEHVEEDVGARGGATGLEEAVRSGRQEVDVNGLGETRGVGIGWRLPGEGIGARGGGG